MKNYKIAIYTICKNEQKFVSRWAENVFEADEVIALDTGSTDNTVIELKKFGIKVYSEKIEPWRFDTARNISLSYVSDDADICLCMDMDEVIEKGWRKKLEDAWATDTTRARYTFACSHNDLGEVTKTHIIEKIHTRKNYDWIHPVHEILHFTGVGEEKVISIFDLTVHHYPDLNKPRAQYLPLLILSAQENPEDSSIAFWLGREYMFSGQYRDAIAELSRHLILKNAVWDEERSASMRFIAYCYQNLKDDDLAKIWYYRACAECPNVREPYLAFARFGYAKQNFPLVYWACIQGLKITQKSGSYLLDEDAWGYALYDLASIACYYLNNFEEALIYARTACDILPDDLRLNNNLKLILAKL